MDKLDGRRDESRRALNCSQCGEQVFPQLISVSVLDMEWQWSVDDEGRCAGCQWDGAAGVDPNR